MNFENVIRLNYIIFLVVLYTISSCKQFKEEKTYQTIVFPSKLEYVSKENNQKESPFDSYKLVYFVRDGECGGCIARLKEWDELIRKKDLSNNIKVYYFVKNCNKVLLENMLTTFNITENIYWDVNDIIGKQIDSLSIGEVLLLNNKDELIFDTDIQEKNIEKQLDIIKNKANL